MSGPIFKFKLAKSCPGQLSLEAHLIAPVVIFPLNVATDESANTYLTEVKLALAMLKLEIIRQIGATEFELIND